MESSSAPPTRRLTIDIWADVVCPWCYLGEQRLSTAVERSPYADDIELRIHTFQLDPAAPATVTSLIEYFEARFGASPDQSRAMEEGMAARVQAEGLPYVVNRPMGNTLDMLRLVHLAAAHGVGWEFLRAVQMELFGGNPAAFEHDTLVQVGVGLGVSAEEAREVLSTDRYAEAVLADHDLALRLGARGVPFTVLGGRLGMPGAVSAEEFAVAIHQAWEQVDVQQ